MTQPTLTQAEVDAAMLGAGTTSHTSDGSPLDPNTPPWLQPVPANTAVPVISGTATVGSTLTCSTGTWNFASSYAYQWLRAGTPIAGATSSSYVPVTADKTNALSCRVTATSSKGSTPATSAPTAVVP
jgi:hypothetical protein